MKKKSKKALTLTALGTAAAYLGICGLLQYEIFERDATLPTKIYEGATGKSKRQKKKVDPNAPKKQPDPRSEWMKTQDFRYYDITNERGQILQGFFLPSATPSNRYVLGSHGYRSRGRGEFRFITKFYHEHGFNVLLVDHSAHGVSEGGNISFGFHESRDLRQWIDFMNETFGNDIEIMLHGVSMGSASVLLLSAMDLPENVRFAVADCSFTSVKDQFAAVLKKSHIPSKALINTVSGINKLKHGFSLDDVSPLKAVRNAKIPIFFAHGLSDGFIPYSMGQELYDNCVTDKDLLLVEHAGHTQSYQKNSEAYEAKILEYADKYMRSETNA